MRKLLALALIVFLSGCASMNYEAPNGTKVSYMRFMTGADSIKGETPEAKVEATGQKSIDPETMQAIIKVFASGVVK